MFQPPAPGTIRGVAQDQLISVLQTAIYTRNDGVLDWRFCTTQNAKQDFEVPGTHIGMAFNSAAYSIIARRLALAHQAGS